ncbi:hypothetical protein [Fodinicurvata sediminis]|uniref:hypothetical protein n=1 Tax=Fodinicurvata sediminis TaxID=1121832 RepID=UPI0003B68CCC|nr:hypothetical protein [Fodinicurvata sediminis]
MMEPVPMDMDEKDWQAQHDLETLIRAEKIKQDKKRLQAAMKKKRELSKALEGMGDKGASTSKKGS